MDSLFKNILAATDFSAIGNNAVDTAIELCKQYKAVLHLLHVVEETNMVDGEKTDIVSAEVEVETDYEARTQLYNIYETVLRTHDIRVQIHMPPGIPCYEICKAATEMPIDLIVVGRHGTSGEHESFMGSTASCILREATKPVITVPANFEPSEFKKILFPVRPGINEKYEIIKPLLNKPFSSVHMVQVDQDNDQTFFSAKYQLQEIAAFLKSEDILCFHSVCTCPDFAVKVLELSKSTPTDLIVINTLPDCNCSSIDAGNYVQQIVSSATVPVLCFQSGMHIDGKTKR
ncbi:universal stress protein [Ferruginibacter paludis]|uniref:universal stress protein n=1 Tax=Ferruginibacter paludis TaxID=1310417 RepID=UPI0025B2C3E4|nr:universal stress protein [Ferruginibacter paludis]MDN3656682.1 universal stress protein [Ferruginibacter paludis]